MTFTIDAVSIATLIVVGRILWTLSEALSTFRAEIGSMRETVRSVEEEVEKIWSKLDGLSCCQRRDP